MWINNRSRSWRTVLVATVALAGAGVTPAAAAHRGGPYTDNDTAAQRHSETVAYVEQVIAEHPTVDGERAFDGRIPKKLRRPYEFPGAANRVARSRYVTVAQSPHRVYRELKQASVPKSRLGGYGDVGAGDLGPRFAIVRFDRDSLPPTMVDGELLIEIQGRPHKRTLLAEFAQVVPHPAWPAAERIPTAHPRVSIVRTKYSERHHVLARSRVVLGHRAAKKLVTGFDDLWIAPPVFCSGGIRLGPSVSYRVRVHSNGHRWTVVTPGECGMSSVTRGAKRALPAVDDTHHFDHLVRVNARPAS